jgi:predicted deacylase
MSAPPIDVPFPDLSRWADGGTGIPYVHTLESPTRGPHVLLQALTHGNEVCGAIALDWLLGSGFRPERGTLSVAFANVAAYESFDPANPYASRCVDEDFNRLWTTEVLDGERQTRDLERARALRPLYERIDFLLDLHSMTDPCPPLALAGRQRKGLELALALGLPEHVVIDAGHSAGRRLRDYAFFDEPDDPRVALLIECGQHWERAAADVARDTLLRFLGHGGVLAEGFVATHLKQLGRLPPAQQQLVRVTDAVVARSLDFRFVREFRGLEVIARAGELIATDGAHEFRAPYDNTVLVMPGTTNLKVGMTTVRMGRFES